MSDPVDLADPEVRRRLLALETGLARVDGVAQVAGPLDRRGPLARARAEAPGRLAALARAAELAPGSAPLRALRAELEASLAFLLHDRTDAARALAGYRTAQAAARAALAVEDPRVARALGADGPGAEEALTEALGDADAAALPAVFWWAFARGAEARAGGFAPDVVADLPRVDAAMRWVLERDPAYFAGGPHLYFALRYAALPRARGGDPDRAVPHFEAVERIAGRDGALLARVLRAEHHAPTLAATPAGTPLDEVLAAQRRAWDAFVEPLREVLAAPVRAVAADLPAAAARARAAELLADPEAHGLIPPPDVALEAPAEPTPGPTLAQGPLARHLTDGERVAFLAVPREGLDPAARATLIEGVRERLAADGTAAAWHLAGPDVVTHELDLGSARSFGGLFPVVAAVMALVLLRALGSAPAVAAVLLAAGLTAVWTIGLVALCGRTLNLLLVVVPAILAVVTTAAALHLVTRFLALEAPDGPLERPAREALWREAARLTARPCLLTTVTTATGFASLGLSGIPPVRDLGLFTAAGVLLSFGLVFGLVPLLLARSARVRPQPAGARWWTPARAERATAWLRARRLPVLGAAAAVAALAALGLSRLTVESHVLRFFPAEHRLPRAYAAVEDELLGLTPLELWLEGDPAELLTAEHLAALDDFLADARREPLVRDVASPLAVDARVDALPGPARAAVLRAGIERGLDEGAPGRAVRRLEGGDLAVRVTLLCRTTSSDACHALAERLRAELPDAPAVRLTGGIPLLVRVQVLLVETQARSFGLALAVVTGLLLLAFRSLGVVALSLVPNTLPIGVTLGLMGAAGIPLDTATVTVAGIALGLVVDDTIHLLHEYVRARAGGGDRPRAVAEALAVVGRPIAATTAAVALGFGAFVVAPFRPTLYFGLLIALTAVLALVCDLVVLPALVLLGTGRAEATEAAAK